MQAGEDGWRDVIDVNLTGVHYTVEVAIPTMVAQGDGGSIVLISSAAGLAGIGSPDAGSIGYAAAKHGLVGLMRIYANHLAPHSIRVNSVHPAGVNTPMINNEFIRDWLGDITATSRAGHGQRAAGAGSRTGGHRQRGGVAGVRRRALRHGHHAAGRRGFHQQTLIVARENPAAQTAFGPMVLAAIEQNEASRAPAGGRRSGGVVPARRPACVCRRDATSLLRRLVIGASERSGPGLWANIACRKRFVDDKLDESLGDIDAVVILGAGLDTRPYRLARRSDIPVFEVDLPVNIARKKAVVRRVLGTQPASVRLVPMDFERDDLATVLAEHGYRTDYRTFFIWEGVTQYLTEDAVRATFDYLRQRRWAADWCSPIYGGISSTA